VKEMLLILVMIPIFFGCEDKCERYHEYVYYEPQYITTKEIRDQFGYETARDLKRPGKIYLYGRYLLINEVGRGIHFIDNIDKSNPVNLGFLNIPGNFDLAVRDNMLYADSYVDLLVVDISSIGNISLVKRLEGVFNANYSFAGALADENTIITEWIEKDVVELTEECGFIDEVRPFLLGFAVRNDAAVMAEFAASAPSAPSTGIGGSMARFTIAGNHLYTVDLSQMFVFDISDPQDPKEGENVQLGWGIETIFPYKSNLYLGAMDGMHIYSIENPDLPEFISTFTHVRSCDPVVVNDDYAFVTLRDGNECGGFVNQLDVVDLTDLRRPTLVRTYPMEHPHGLGLDENSLFICEGESGIKVFDATDVNAIDQNLIDHIEGVHALDVIPYNDNLMMIGNDGLYQYDYSNPGELTLLSKITVNFADSIQ